METALADCLEKSEYSVIIGATNSKDSVVQSYLEEKAQNNESWGQIYKHYRKVMGLDESNT